MSLAIVKVDIGASQKQIALMISRGQNPKPLLRQLSGIMHHAVDMNFEAGGRSPQWPESQRVKKHGGQTLIEKKQLFNSIQEFLTGNSAGVATNKVYAKIHNFGGTIQREPRYSTIRLRTDAKGRLLRQGTEGREANLAVFGKLKHKRVTTRTRVIKRYTIDIPKREFMHLEPADHQAMRTAALKWLTGR